jgi:NAD(P) transhydrogenase
MMLSTNYDLLVIGSGPAGIKGAIAAAKLGKKVAIIDRSGMLGGVSLHSGTIPSKTMREAVLHLTGFKQRAFYGSDYTSKSNINPRDFRLWVDTVVRHEVQTIKRQLQKNKVELINGYASFQNENTLEITSGSSCTLASASKFLVACGTRPAHGPNVPIDGKRILDVNQISHSGDIPKKAIVVGAGVVGLEFACMFAALGIKITVIDQRDSILQFVDREISERLVYHMRNLGVTFRLNETVTSVNYNNTKQVVAHTESQKKIIGDMLLYAVGRQANTDTLKLENINLETDNYGRLPVNEFFQTKIEHIYAAGDVIGFPALAATSMEQGRLSAHHMFGKVKKQSQDLLPFGVYTIPEISLVGKTEQELTRDRIPYEFGIAKYDEIARGQIIGDNIGMLKILFDPITLKLHGLHIIGEGSTELIHIGQTVMALGGTLEYLRDNVFNYPTLAEAYKVAALNGLNKL